MRDLFDVWRADLLFTLRHHDEVHRHFLSRTTDRMQRRQKGGLWSLLIHGTASDNHFAERRLVDQPRFRRRRRPLRRIELFHVVHEVKTDRFRPARIKLGEYTRLPLCINHGRLLKSGIAGEFRHVFRAVRVTAILRGDRHLTDPIL